MGFWIFLGIIVALVAWAVSIYNGLVTLRNRFKNAFAQIDVQLKRRYDLIPNLVETAKGYLKHERETLDAVIKARNAAQGAAQAAAAAPGNPAAMQGLGQAEGALSGTLGRLFALAEAYPDLKASDNFRDLHNKLVDTENQIQFARRYYNGAVNLLNNRIQRFPDLLIANTFGFKLAEFFDLPDAAAARAPAVALQ